MLRAGRAVALLAVVSLGHPALAQDAPTGDPVAGHRLAQRVCKACHGLNGIATLPEAANLAGQDAGYLARQLAAFHSGERKNETMAAVSQMLNGKQMADVAAYYGSIKIEVKPPQIPQTVTPPAASAPP